MMKHQNIDMKEMVQQIQREIDVVERMDLKNQPLVEIEGFQEITKKTDKMGRSASKRMTKAMKVNRVWYDKLSI